MSSHTAKLAVVFYYFRVYRIKVFTIWEKNGGIYLQCFDFNYSATAMYYSVTVNLIVKGIWAQEYKYK